MCRKGTCGLGSHNGIYNVCTIQESIRELTMTHYFLPHHLACPLPPLVYSLSLLSSDFSLASSLASCLLLRGFSGLLSSAAASGLLISTDGGATEAWSDGCGDSEGYTVGLTRRGCCGRKCSWQGSYSGHALEDVTSARSRWWSFVFKMSRRKRIEVLPGSSA